MGSVFKSKPTPEKFGQLVVAELRKIGVEATYHPGDCSISYTFQGNPVKLDLNQYFSHYSENGRAVVEHIVQFVQRSTSQKRVDRREAQKLLVPRIDARAFIEQSRLEGKPVPHQVLGESLAITLGLDYPELIEEVQQSHLDDWGMTVEQALRFARENLWSRSQSPLVERAPGVFQGTYGDGNDAARVLLEKHLQRLELPGGPVVSLPEPAVLLVTGLNDIDGLEYLLSLSIERQFTLHPLQLRSESRPSSLHTEHEYVTSTWEPLTLPADHPHAETLRSLDHEEKVLEYARQREFLQQHSPDLKVAECQPMGGMTTLARWTSSEPWLLPEVDQTHDGREQLSWAMTKHRYSLVQTEHWPRLWSYKPYKALD